MHLLLLAVLIVMLLVAARMVYNSFRNEAIRAVQSRQHLLAIQTTRGIESDYQSILSVLDLMGQWKGKWGGAAATVPATSPMARIWNLAPLLWDQLQGRASRLFALDPDSMVVLKSFASSDAQAGWSAERIAKQNEAWLRRTLRRAVSPLVMIDNRRVTLVSLRVSGPGGLLLVAVVPVDRIDSQFLSKLGSGPRPLAALLLDDQGGILAFAQPQMLMKQVTSLDDPRLAKMAHRFLQLGRTGDQSFRTPLKIEPVGLQPTITTLYPVQVGGHQWWLAISSSLSYVDEVLGRLFRQIIWWSLFVILSLSALLASSFVTVLRGRFRLERLRHEMLKREVDQAREIQLAWLPARNQTVGRVDIAAVNHPANHISGDFYNWFELDDGRLVVCVGDVTGHGMAAAFLMATTQLLVRTSMLRLKDPGAAMGEINDQLCTQVFNGQFVTLLILVLDLDHKRVTAATGGHYPPLIGGAAGGFRPASIHPQLVLGIEPHLTFPTEEFDLPADACLLLYTDGVLDAQAPDGSRYDQARLEQTMDRDFTDAREMIDDITASLKHFCRGRAPADDLTLVAVRLEKIVARSGGAGAATGQ